MLHSRATDMDMVKLLFFLSDLKDSFYSYHSNHFDLSGKFFSLSNE